MSTRTIRDLDPATGELIAEIPVATPEEVGVAVAAARAASAEWADVPFEARAELLRRAGERIAERTDELAQLVTREMGKPVEQARREVASRPKEIESAIETARRALEPEDVSEGDATSTIVRDPLGVLTETMRSRDQVRWQVGPFRFIVVNHPDDVRHVLITNQRNYIKSRTYKPLSLVLGSGLVTSEGELWKRQRRLVQPAFHHRRLAEFADTMVACARDLVDAWEGVDQPIDAHEAMNALTFRIVGRTLFSTELAGEARAMGEALGVAIERVAEMAELLLYLPTWVPTRKNRRFNRARKTLDDVVLRMIAERRQEPGERGDLLDMLMAATDEEDGLGMSDQQLRDEVMTLVLAGHETTANAMTWTWLLLSRHVDVQRKLAAELDAVLGGRPPTLADLERLPYTGQVISEAMRLYPPVWFVERTALADDTIHGYRVPAGSIVGISPWTLHRRLDAWPNAEGFDPERWAPGRERERPRHAYLPFGAGPRVCIGNAFALMEARLILATIAQRYHLDLVPGQTITPDPGITLRPSAPVRMTLRRREASACRGR